MNPYLHPITFSIPKIKITNTIHSKKKICSDLIPGQLSTYIYDNEESYYDEYKQSLFATTTKKGGWDCLRHYEIMANGCIPYFPNLESCPPNTLYFFPKELILESNRIYESISPEGLDDNKFEKCMNIIKKLVLYTHNNLTTERTASYILSKSSILNPQKILFLSQSIDPDYLRCLTLHGFKTRFGINCDDYPKIPHLYTDYIIPNDKLYGKGMTYSKLLSNELHQSKTEEEILTNIKNKYYDAIIYGSFHRGMPYYDFILSYYSPEKIILLCGEDEHLCTHIRYTDLSHHVFVREL